MTTKNQLKMLVLGLTGECNFSCSYCYAHSHPHKIMDIDIAVRAVTMATESGKPFVLQFSGGEPFMAFDVMKDIVQYVRRRQIPAIVQVQTNASLIDRDIAVYLRNAQVGVGISLDGRPSQNDTLRRLPSGEGTSALIIRGAEALAAAGVEIGITCVVTDSNVRNLPGIVEMAHYLGNVRKIGFDLLRAQGRGSRVKAAGAQDLEKALQQVLITARNFEVKTGNKLVFSHAERVAGLASQSLAGFAHCHAMNGEAAFVDADGEMYACASLAGLPEFRLGSVKDGIDPLKQQTIGAMIRNSMGFCAACPSFSLCGGGCFARWYGVGSVGKPYLPECALKKVFIREYQEQKAQVNFEQ